MPILSNAFTSAGTQLSVSLAQPGAYTVPGFEALNFTRVGEVVDMGTLGKKYNLVTHNPIDSRGTVKRKGSYNSGTMSIKMARVTSNGGQALLLSGQDQDAPISVKIVLQDGTTLYFIAVVMGLQTEIGSVDQITSASVDLEISDDILQKTV